MMTHASLSLLIGGELLYLDIALRRERKGGSRLDNVLPLANQGPYFSLDIAYGGMILRRGDGDI